MSNVDKQDRILTTSEVAQLHVKHVVENSGGIRDVVPVDYFTQRRLIETLQANNVASEKPGSEDMQL